jgi:hypothetical protein
MALDHDFGIHVLADKTGLPEWRVEYFDDDGGCYVTIFAGPGAEVRAREYYDAIQSGTLKAITVGC